MVTYATHEKSGKADRSRYDNSNRESKRVRSRYVRNPAKEDVVAEINKLTYEMAVIRI